MVTTRRRVDFVLGRTDLQGRKLNASESVEVVRELIKIIEPEFARGFTSVHNILLGKDNYFDKRKLPEQEAQLVRTALGEHSLPPNTLFIDLGAVIRFPDKPRVRKVHRRGELWDTIRVKVKTARLLLSRKGKIWLLRVIWKPELVEICDRGLDEYKYLVDRVELSVLDDACLRNIFARYNKRDDIMTFGEQVIHLLYRIQFTTSDALASAVRYAKRRTRQVARVIDRLKLGLVRNEDL